MTAGGVVVAMLLTTTGTAGAQTLTGAAAPTESPSTGPTRPPGYESSAAYLLGWGEPNQVDDFDSGLGPDWRVYDGPGHIGNGVRSPDAVDVDAGIMTITGDSNGTTGGMAWFPGQKYGRWEGRVRVPPGDETYHALMLLWPDAEDFPVGGEVDFMEMMEPTRQRTQLFLHYGKDNSQVMGEIGIDGTQWHNWAVEWTPEHIAAFVDGKQWWRTDDTSILPPGPMHLCIQLDWFPGDGQGAVQESTMQVDWVRQYPLRVAESPVGPEPSQPSEPEPTAPQSSAPPAPTEAPGIPPAPVPSPPTGTAPVWTTAPTSPTADPVLAQIRARLGELAAEFRTLLVSYLIASGSGR
jgi:licheninase